MSARNSVVDPIEAGWRRLNALVDSLGPQGLTVTGRDGWAVKDHLVHIAAWERSLLALLQGVDRAAAMGVPDLDETDAINAAVWSLHRHKTPEEALAYLHDTHAQLMAALDKLSDQDLQLAYNRYQPADPKESPEGDQPVIDWVAGDTYDHYKEHIEWIGQLLASNPAR